MAKKKVFIRCGLCGRKVPREEMVYDQVYGDLICMCHRN